MFNNSKAITHKQSKYFTLMLIPYSSGKTHSIRIPMLTFYVVISFIAVSITAVTGFAIATNHFKSAANAAYNDLEKTTEDNIKLSKERTKLRLDLLDEKANAEQYTKEQIDTYEEKINQYEEKARELEEKLQELEDAKEEIYKQLSAKSYLPSIIPTSQIEIRTEGQTESKDTAAFMGMGFSEEKSVLAELDERYAKLDSDVDNEVSSYEHLLSSVKKLKPYLDNYPNVWPVRGEVTSEHSSRQNPFGRNATEFHKGIDIAVDTGTNVRATGGGKVIFSGYDGDFGYIVRIRHGYGLVTYYAHNSRNLVSEGDIVKRGDIIAKSGNTGRSTGPHVHYEVLHDGVSLNPRNYIGK